MSERTSWIGCVLAGLATLIMAMFIFPMFPPDAAGDIQPYALPIYAFEFARTPADLIAIFGGADDPERARKLVMMDKGNRWDFLFMSLYTVFGLSFGWAARRSGLSMTALIIGCAVIAGLADAVETRLLLSITQALATDQPQGAALDWLWLPVLIKFAMIGLTIVSAGLAFWRHQVQPWKAVGGIMMILGFLPVVFAFGINGFLLDAGTAIGMGWVLMLAYAAIRVVRGPIPLRP